MTDSLVVEKIKCTNCGYEKRAKTNFCSRCGSKLPKEKPNSQVNINRIYDKNIMKASKKTENKKVQKKQTYQERIEEKIGQTPKNKKIQKKMSNLDFAWCLCCIVALLLFLMVFSGNIGNMKTDNSQDNITSNISDNIPYENITMINVDTFYEDKSNPWGDHYIYFFGCDLSDVSSSLIGSEVVVYFYDQDKNLLKNNYHSTDYSNKTSITIDNGNYINSDKSVVVSALLNRKDLVNIGSCQIVIIKDNQTIFNETEPFNMTLVDLDEENSISAFDEE